MKDEISVDVSLNTETINRLNRMTKADLINQICAYAVEIKVANSEVENMRAKLIQAEAFV